MISQTLKQLTRWQALAAFGLLLTLAGAALYVARRTDPGRLAYNPAFDAYLSAFTSGEIARRSPVQIRFAYDLIPADQVGAGLDAEVFRFRPEIRGKARWADTRTLVFEPEAPLPSGQRYTGELDVRAVAPEIPRDLSTFYFQFATRPQSARVELTRTRSFGNADRQWHEVSGIVRTADYEPADQVEAFLRVRTGRQPLKVRWSHNDADNTHTFTVDSLERRSDAYTLTMDWDGGRAGFESEGEEELEIPALGVFRHMHTYSYGEPEQYVVVEFSDPLAPRQDLDGLIRLGNQPVKFLIDGNRVKLFPTGRITGQTRLRIEPGIASESGEQTRLPLEELVAFEEIKPEVRLIGKGNILPRGDKLPFLFEAVGLRAVDIRVIKIFEKNIPQFLQVNQLGEDQELKRVGQLVVQKRIDLTGTAGLDLNTWNRHSLDLSSLINADPGAIYEIAIGFRKSYALAACSAEDGEAEDRDMLALSETWNMPDGSYNYWDYYEDYYYEENWYENHENPCKSAYYSRDKIARRNVLASDLGLIAKRGDLGAVFAVTDLKTTQPLQGVQLELYDFQHQLMGTFSTDKDGFAKTSLSKQPFLLIAKQGNQRGYLRLDDGSSLSISAFNVDGKKYVKGVKGFIYGERGVWRPGDPIYLNFVLEDKDKTLPAGHPVIFELIDPQGKQVQRITRTQSVGNFYAFHTETAEDAPTGNYQARVRVGGATFSQTVKVEAIIPNRLKIDLSFPGSYLSSRSASTFADLKAQWLTGAVSGGLKADVAVTLRKAETKFDAYPGYLFDDPTRSFPASEEQVIFDGTLDGSGNARVPLGVEVAEEAPGMLNASFVTRVYEPGGAFSIDRFSTKYSPYSAYAGIKLPKPDVVWGMYHTDKDQTVGIATVSPDGKPISSTVEVKLYKIEWNWWWDGGYTQLGAYRESIIENEVSSGTVRTVNGTGSWKIRLAYPAWGRYLLLATDQSGHTSGTVLYFDWPGWYKRSGDTDREAAQMLAFSADKETYNVGETVNLSIPTAAAGRALVSIEAGSKVLQTHWLSTNAGTTKFSFKSTPDMAPNAFVHVTFIQPHAQTQNDLPIRLYGVIPIGVEDPATHLKPSISMANELEPSSKFTVQVSEATGQPMTYTLAVVDEGLLGITRYKTPDPWNTFYQRQALDVKSYDLYDQVLGAYGGEINSMLSIGGDAGDIGPAGRKADRFTPVVIFLGPFELKAGQSQPHTLLMPNYVGAVRVMAVAGNPAGAYGMAEKSVPVKKPLMVLATLPRVLGPGERLNLPVSVFATDNTVKTASVSVELSKNLLLEGAANQTVTFAQPSDKVLTFKLGVLNTLGKASVKVTAQSGSQVAVYETDIEIRSPNPPVTDVVTAVVEGGKTAKLPFKSVGMPGTNTNLLEVSSIPPINLGQRLQWLIRYPYGCLEQTTSGAFPQVYLSSLLDLTPQMKERTDQNVREGIRRLAGFQRPNGGFAYWPGGSYAYEWADAYAGHFLLEARKAGYSVPDAMLDSWRNHLRDQARNWNAKTDRDETMNQAYRLYLLALSGNAEMGAMNRMRQLTGVPHVALWMLAGAYHLAGQQDAAKKMIASLSKDVSPYNQMAGTFGSHLRDQAIVLQTLSIMGQQQQGGELVRTIATRLSNGREWLSTQEIAYSLAAVAQYTGNSGIPANYRFAWRTGGGDWQEVSASKPLWQIPLEAAQGELEIANRGSSPVFPRILLEGIPAVGDTTNASNGLSMSVVYAALDGKSLDISKIPQGTDFVAKVTVKNTGQRGYEELALTQIFPSGWEIINTRLDGTDAGGDAPSYQDFRDDRVNTFYHLSTGQTKTFHVRLSAAYQGRYYLGSVSTSAMYDRTVNARVRGRWVEVLPGRQGG
jgi:hypothetical protein